MFKISIIPDTNVMLSNLELIKDIYTCKIPLPFTVNFAKTVITELESKKIIKEEARQAIRFLANVSDSLKTEIEGKIDDRKIDVVIEGKQPIEVANNDDKILNYCLQLENPIFLTNDKAFYLKCLSFNIKTIIVGNKGIQELISAILNEFGVNETEQEKENQNNYISKVRISLKKTLLPTIILILEREFGPGYNLNADQDANLDFYLDFVSNNFHLFRNFLPAQSPMLIKKMLKNLKDGNTSEIKRMIHPICMIFRKSAPEDIL